MKTVLVGIIALFSLSAFADQCDYNKATDASSARKLLKDNQIMEWCQLCAEKRPTGIHQVSAVKTKKVSADNREVNVQLDGAKEWKSIDLAYTYVRVGSDMFANVAQLVGCQSQGSVTFVQTGPGKRKTAHYYDGQGQRHNVGEPELEEIAVGYDYKTDLARMPASK